MLLVPKLSTTPSSYDTKVPLYFLQHILNRLMDFLGIYLALCSLCIIPSASYVVIVDFGFLGRMHWQRSLFSYPRFFLFNIHVDGSNYDLQAIYIPILDHTRKSALARKVF